MKHEDLIKREIPADDSTSLGEKMLLYWLIRELKPKTIVETGTHRALTTMYMAHALYDEGLDGSIIHTFDPFEWGQRANVAKIEPLSKYVVVHQKRGDTCDVKDIDFFFCDGFHEDFEVLQEMAVIGPNLSKRAVVVFHDCWYGNTDGVNEAVEKLGLKTIWLPTKNAIRIYSKYEDKPTA